VFLCPGCHTRSETVVGVCSVCGYVGRGQEVGPVPCSVEGCNRDPYARGLCEPHYLRAYRAEKRGEEPDLGPVRLPGEPARVVLSMRVSPQAKARAAADPDGARGALEAWASS
jgi:hypothetical protein